MRKIYISILATVLSCIGFSQEINLKSEIPDNLIGTWVMEIKGEGEIPSQMMKYVFRNDDSDGNVCEFHWLFKRSPDKEYITVGVEYGYLKVGSKIFQSKTFKAGSQQVQPMEMKFDDTIKWYYPGDDRYEQFPKGQTARYEIQGNKLIIKNDDNGDGDYDDEGELQVYIKSN